MNSVVHFELPVKDPATAGMFYAEVFKWQIKPMPEMDYTIAITTEVDSQQMPIIPGAINGGLTKSLTAPSFAIQVDDIDSYLEKITGRGGKVVQAKTEVGKMGFMAYFSDPEGNVLSLWQLPA
jgi:hypothetical protein